MIWRAALATYLDVVLTALVPTILAASSWWAFWIARRFDSWLPSRLTPPHATRRLSLPRDARALRAVCPALLGSLMILLALVYSLGAAVLTGSLPAGTMTGFTEFGPRASRNFRRVRALLALRAQEVRLKDQRMPVVLLRSFADDELAMQRTKALPFAPQFSQYLKAKLSLEEQIVEQLWEVGPVVPSGSQGWKSTDRRAARLISARRGGRAATLIEEAPGRGGAWMSQDCWDASNCRSVRVHAPYAAERHWRGRRW